MIKDSSKPFFISNLETGAFLKLGSNAKRTQILYLTSIEKNEVRLDPDSVLDYGPHCRCYPVINLTNTIVGSLLVLDNRHLEYSALRLIIRNKQEIGEFAIHQVEGVGGLMAFIDSYDNILVLPATPPQNKLTVVDQGDQIG